MSMTMAELEELFGDVRTMAAIAVDPADPHYSPAALYVSVFLDGQEIDLAIRAHVGEGYVDRYVRGAGNAMVFDEHGRFQTERLRGVVELRWSRAVIVS